MWNAGLDEAQAEIKIARRNINNLRYADDTTLMAESEHELKNFLMKVKEESENTCLKLNIQKTKIIASGAITSWQINQETVETVTDFILGGSKIKNHTWQSDWTACLPDIDVNDAFPMCPSLSFPHCVYNNTVKKLSSNEK